MRLLSLTRFVHSTPCLLSGLTLLLSLAACDTSIQAGTCDPSSCGGCCSADGRCVAGSANDACGKAGGACVDCFSRGQQCFLSACTNGVSGGGSGGTGGGSSGGGAGGGSGGGVTTLNQELVSGSRLRAIHLVGADGSKAPWYGPGPVFWDSQLETICQPSGYGIQNLAAAANGGLCFPSAYSLEYIVYSDSNCRTPLGQNPVQSLFLGRTLKNYLYKSLPDGGAEFYLQSNTPFVGSVWSLRVVFSSGCTATGPSDGGQFGPVGLPVAPVGMTVTIE